MFRVIVEALGLGHYTSQCVLKELGYSPYSCLKACPIGQTLGHTFGDAPALRLTYLSCWGGKEVEADRKTVVLNSPTTVELVKFDGRLRKDAHDEGGRERDLFQQTAPFFPRDLFAPCSRKLHRFG